MGKGIKIRADIIREYVSKEDYEILEMKLIEKNIRLFTCPSCRKKFDITGIRDAVLTCPDCQAKTCRGCLLPAHEGKCSEAERQSVHYIYIYIYIGNESPKGCWSNYGMCMP